MSTREQECEQGDEKEELARQDVVRKAAGLRKKWVAIW